MSFHPDKFPANDIDSLKTQLDNWLGDILPLNQSNAGSPWSLLDSSSEPSVDVAKTDYVLGESFLVYRLDATPFMSGDIPDSDLVELAEATGRWHHQLIANHKAIGFSRSLVSDNGISQMFISDLAATIQDAIVWLNAFEKEHPEYVADLPRVRLLIVPGFNVYAFWIQRTEDGEREGKAKLNSHVLVIWAPESMNLPRERLLDTKQFLSAFYRATPALGLRSDGSSINEE